MGAVADGPSISGVVSRSGGVIDINGAWVAEQKRGKTGRLARRAKVRVEIRADSLIVDAGAKEAVALQASAVREIIQDQMRKIPAFASPETIARRERAARNPGTRSYKRRYQGGRTGHTPPDSHSAKWGIDSGRMINGIHVTLRTSSTGQPTATVNVPANRLEPISFGLQRFGEFRDKLRQWVPALDGKLNATAEARAKMEAVVKEIARSVVVTSEAKYRALQRRRRALMIRLLGQTLGVPTPILSLLTR